MTKLLPRWFRWSVEALALACATILVGGTITNVDFWFTANQRGQRLMERGDDQLAAKTFDDPMRQGVALYRTGDFAEASAAFSHVGSAEGAFDQGNALLMQGQYDKCIKAYDQALALRPGWREAMDNRSLATARKRQLDKAADDGTGGQDEPDSIVFDNKADQDRAKTVEINAGEPVSDEQIRAAWLRRVQTKPADFLRAKFSYQLQQSKGQR